MGSGQGPWWARYNPIQHGILEGCQSFMPRSLSVGCFLGGMAGTQEEEGLQMGRSVMWDQIELLRAKGIDRYYTPRVKKVPDTKADHSSTPLTGQQLPTSRITELVPKVLCSWFPIRGSSLWSLLYIRPLPISPKEEVVVLGPQDKYSRV